MQEPDLWIEGNETEGRLKITELLTDSGNVPLIIAATIINYYYLLQVSG